MINPKPPKQMIPCMFHRVCFFVLCNRHRFNRFPGPPPRDELQSWGLSLNSPNSGIGLFYADSGFFDGKNRVFWRIGSKPFLWGILKTGEKARCKTPRVSTTEPWSKSRIRGGGGGHFLREFKDEGVDPPLYRGDYTWKRTHPLKNL